VGSDEEVTDCVATQSVTLAMSSGDRADEAGDSGGVIGPEIAEPSNRYILLMVRRDDECQWVGLMILVHDGDGVQSPDRGAWQPWREPKPATIDTIEGTG
jgi:hypothetical protein